MEGSPETRTVRAIVAVDPRLREHPSVVTLFPDPAVRVRFLQEARSVRIPGGHRLFEEGDPGNAVYLVLHGRLQVLVRRNGVEHRTTDIGAGELCGERALVMGGRRTGSVVALRDSELLELDHAGFERLAVQLPAAMLTLVRAMASRLAAAVEADRRGRISTIAVVPLSGSRRCADLADRLVEALERFGTVLRLRRRDVDEALGESTAESPFADDGGTRKLAAWMHAREAEHRFVLYEAEPGDSLWSHRCMRQADRVLLVADADDPPHCTPSDDYLRQHLLSRGTGREMALVGAGAAVDGSAWLKPRELVELQHIRDQGSVERLARRFAGKEVGLVLSGGGARCAAHIGGVRALVEAGMPIDRIGGTSGGAFFAAQFAQGFSAEEVLARSREQLLGGRLWDVAMPMHGLISGKRWKRIFLNLFADTRIESLPTPFFCVSTNLSLGVQAVHREGLLWRWVRASMSIPGLSPPLFEDGLIYVDGSVLNNLPLDVMRDLATGPVVALQATDDHGPRAAAGTSSVPPPWKALRNRWGGKGVSPVPGIVDVLVGATMIGGVRASRRLEGLADRLIRFDVDDVGRLEFEALEAVAERGYEQARRFLDEHGLPDID